MMKTLPLLTVLLFVGIAYACADEGADTRRTETIPRISDDDIQNMVDDAMKEVRRFREHLERRNETEKAVYAIMQKERERLKKKQKEKHHTKLYIKVIGGLIAVCVFLGITFCYKSMCKKKQRSGAVDPEETMDVLHPNADIPELGSYPDPQKRPYPVQQMPNRAEQPPLSVPLLNHPQQQTPCPTEQSSFSMQHMSYPPPQQTFYPMQKKPFSAPPMPYLQEQTPHCLQTNVHSPQSGFTYPKDPTTYTPPPP